MGTRLLKLIIAAVVAAGLLVVGWPQFFSLQDDAPFAQLVSFRLASAVVAAIAVSVLLLIAIFARNVRRFILVLASFGIIFALAITAVQGVRGYESADPRPHRLADLRLLSWNIEHDAVTAEEIVQRAADAEADVVALQEATPEKVQAVADLLAAAGRPMSAFAVADETDPTLSTGLLVSTALGEYAIDASSSVTAMMPSVVVRSTAAGAPVFVSAHAAPPVASAMAIWRSDLTRLAALCTAEDDLVLMGDLNSTLDHWSDLPGTADLGSCTDAASQAGGAAVATWPTTAPAWVGAAIDHVAFTGFREVSGYQVLDAGPSDHRPVVAQLSVERMTKHVE